MMHRETELRCAMTPDVLTPLGRDLADAARIAGGGARITGAGGGGCLWAMGDDAAVARIRAEWETLLAEHPQAYLMPVKINRNGLIIYSRRASS